MKHPPLMGRIGNCFLAWRRHLQKGYAPMGITLKQLYLLGALARREYLHPAEVAERLFCDRPTATVVIRNMERAGWVRRERDPADGKRLRVSLTSAGRRKLADVRADPGNPERRPGPESALSPGELEALHGLLGKLEAFIGTLPKE